MISLKFVTTVPALSLRSCVAHSPDCFDLQQHPNAEWPTCCTAFVIASTSAVIRGMPAPSSRWYLPFFLEKPTLPAELLAAGVNKAKLPRRLTRLFRSTSSGKALTQAPLATGFVGRTCSTDHSALSRAGVAAAAPPTVVSDAACTAEFTRSKTALTSAGSRPPRRGQESAASSFSRLCAEDHQLQWIFPGRDGL